MQNWPVFAEGDKGPMFKLFPELKGYPYVFFGNTNFGGGAHGFALLYKSRSQTSIDGSCVVAEGRQHGCLAAPLATDRVVCLH